MSQEQLSQCPSHRVGLRGIYQESLDGSRRRYRERWDTGEDEDGEGEESNDLKAGFLLKNWDGYSNLVLGKVLF